MTREVRRHPYDRLIWKSSSVRNISGSGDADLRTAAPELSPPLEPLLRLCAHLCRGLVAVGINRSGRESHERLGAVGVDPHSLGGVSRLGVVVHEVADLIAELFEELRILKRLKRLDHGEARILGEVLKVDRLVRDLVLG